MTRDETQNHIQEFARRHAAARDAMLKTAEQTRDAFEKNQRLTEARIMSERVAHAADGYLLARPTEEHGDHDWHMAVRGTHKSLMAGAYEHDLALEAPMARAGSTPAGGEAGGHSE